MSFFISGGLVVRYLKGYLLWTLSYWETSMHTWGTRTIIDSKILSWVMNCFGHLNQLSIARNRHNVPTQRCSLACAILELSSTKVRQFCSCMICLFCVVKRRIIIRSAFSIFGGAQMSHNNLDKQSGFAWNLWLRVPSKRNSAHTSGKISSADWSWGYWGWMDHIKGFNRCRCFKELLLETDRY